MKKIVFLVISLCLFSALSFVFADESAPDNSNWGISPLSQDEQDMEEYTSASEDTWNHELDIKIYDNYGSEKSPAFLNREHMNQSDTDYGTGSGGDGPN